MVKNLLCLVVQLETFSPINSLLTFSQFLLGTIKIEFHIQIFNKWSYGVAVGIGFLLDYLHQIKHNIPSWTVVDHRSCRQVSENPRTSWLDSVKILLSVQKQFNNQFFPSIHNLLDSTKKYRAHLSYEFYQQFFNFAAMIWGLMWFV